MRVYEDIASSLAEVGVDTMFGLLGDANMYVAGAFEARGGRLIRVAHEASAVAMADLHSRVTGSLAVATVTHGPGFTNAITPLVEAQRSASPVLLITGDPPPEATHMQRLDIAALCAAVGVAHERVHTAGSVRRDLNRALATVESTGRPLVLNVPIPVSLSETTGEGRLTAYGRRVGRRVSAPVDEADLDEALGLMASAARPVVLGGRGAVLAGAGGEIAGLADILNAPLFVSGQGLGLFRDHPRYAGIMGSIAHAESTELLMQADCVIAFGASLNKYTSFGGEMFEGKTVVHVDADPVKIGWYVSPDAAVVGDAKAVAAAAGELLKEIGLPAKSEWLQRGEAVSDAIRGWLPEPYPGAPGTIDIRLASTLIGELLPPRTRYVSDVGRFIAGSWPYLSKVADGTFSAMTGFGSIGLGISAAIGAALADRDAPLTVGLIGDGGFMMAASEIGTAVRERLPILYLVFNDGAYGAEYPKLIAAGMSAEHAFNNWPDIGATAAGLGARALTITGADDIPELAELLGAGLRGPCVVDIRLDPTHHLPF